MFFGMFALVAALTAPTDVVEQTSFSASSTSSFATIEADVPTHDPSTSSWENKGPAEHSEVLLLTVQLSLKAANRDALEAAFWAVSTPTDPRYGQHLSIKDITKLLNVEKDKVERVRRFFLDAGALEVTPSPYNDVLSVRIKVGDAQRALRTKISTFEHRERPDVGRILRSSTSYSLPIAIAPDVALVGELLQFPRVRPRLGELADEAGADKVAVGGRWPNACEDAPPCKGRVTPAVLKQRYQISDDDDDEATLRADAMSSMSVAEFQGQHFKPEDVARFSHACHVNATVNKVIGGDLPATAGVEAELDIEYIKGVAQNIPLTVIYANKYSLLDWANKITGMLDAPLVHSVSYGNDEKQQSGTDYMYAVNTAFLKAGARGLSILFASGDQGVCGREGCGFLRRFQRFKPDFPGGSPYHTSVGGTDFVTQEIGEEKVWSNGGGGFSDHFGIPAYQAEMVAGFKANSSAMGLLPPAHLYNDTGRGYPDVAALGGQKAPYCVATRGSFMGVAGTSASTPVVGGIIAKLNGLRLAKGGKPLGFLNPFLYANPGAFNDVTKGKNPGGSILGRYGFTAIRGWDPASGLGTPNFSALSKLV